MTDAKGNAGMYVNLVALVVTDYAAYDRYRAAMAPILESYGGSFGYDLRVSEVLKSPTRRDLNRVFTLQFPDRAAKDRFFSDPSYKSVKAEHFTAAVAHAEIVSEFELSPLPPR